MRELAALTKRHLLTVIRIPVFVALTLVQPIIWLVLYGQLFQKAVQIPGFSAANYTQFLAPGLVIMTALFSSIWNGMSIIDDLSHGVIDRYLSTPASRLSMVLARMLALSVQIAIQAVIVMTLAFILGGGLPAGGLTGAVLVVPVACLVCVGFGSLSYGLAMATRREEAMIGIGNFVTLPLVFCSATFMAQNLMPSWMQAVAQANPVQWAVLAAREGLSAEADWSVVTVRGLLLVAFAAAMVAFAVRSHDRYQQQL
jgi:ABC-2 type transport system permease protein